MKSRYEIRETIGQGGLGSVYKAYDNQLQREVAMKRVLNPDDASPEEIESSGKKLIAEAQTLSTLNHPNIITVFDVGTDEEGGFVVMELLKGETLDETVERGVLTADDFKEVVFQTMEGLIAAQAANVIHRDIKPTNIMLIWQASGKFQLKILDFGLAKFSKAPSVQTMDQDDAVMGSIFFMAPEQFERVELDARTDLYQMGCVYYNALTGQYPFNGDTAPQVMNAHLQHKVVPLDQLRPDLPPAMSQWVMWLINRDIASRPTNAAEALKYFPKDASSAPALPAQAAIPVATPAPPGSPTIKIATPGANAQAPPNLIVGSTTTNLQGGTGAAVPVRTTGHTPTVTTGQTVARTPQQTTSSSGKTKRLMLVIGIGALVVAGVAAFLFLKTQKTNDAIKHVIALSEEEAPTGTAKDVNLLVKFMTNEKSEYRMQAYQALSKLEGSGVEAVLLDHLEKETRATQRKQLGTLVSTRGYAPAIDTLISYATTARSEKDKIAFLNLAKPLATNDQLLSFLDGLKTEKSLVIRKVYEDTILTIVRRSGNPETALKNIRGRIRSAEGGGERRSLYRILGVMGGAETERVLERVFAGKDDSEKLDAVAAYYSWPNRDPLPKVLEIARSNNKSLSVAAQHAYSLLTGKPGPHDITKEIEDWKVGFELLENNPSQMQKMLQRTIESPHPATVAMLEEWKADKRIGRYAQSIADSLKKSLSRMVVLESGKELTGSKARVQGDGIAQVKPFLESISSWRSPETYFTWNFKIKDGGDYSISVNQADLNDSPSDFVIYLAGQTLKGKSAKTPSIEEFKEVKLPGKVTLKKGEVYKLTLLAGENIQPRMMDIRSVVLKK